MKVFSIRLAGASLIALAAAGCTTSGIGTGQVVGQNVGATFSWTQSGGTRGTMVAQLSNGQVYQGPFFQITSESIVDYDPLWNGRRPESAVSTPKLGTWLGRTRLGLWLGRLGAVGPVHGHGHALQRPGARQPPGSWRLHALRLQADATELRNGRRWHGPVPASHRNDHPGAVPARPRLLS